MTRGLDAALEASLLGASPLQARGLLVGQQKSRGTADEADQVGLDGRIDQRRWRMKIAI